MKIDLSRYEAEEIVTLIEDHGAHDKRLRNLVRDISYMFGMVVDDSKIKDDDQ